MTDIFQEVEADLRREKVAVLWQRFGVYVILVAVLIVAITAGWRGYEAWRTERDRTAGDAFTALLATARDVRTEGSAEALASFADDAPAGYAMLARLRAATAFARAGDTAKANELLRGVAEDTAVDSLYRDLARVRLAQALIDAGDTGAAKDVAAPIAADAGNAFTRSAQELMGLAAFIENDAAAATRWFTALTQDVGVSSAMRGRAQEMLNLVAVAPAAGEAAPAAPATTEAPAVAAPPTADATPADATPAGPEAATAPATAASGGTTTGDGAGATAAQETN